MPITSIVAILGLFSMASLPPMIGYISKELIYEAKVRVATLSPYLLVIGLISFVFLFAVSLLVTYRVFFARPAPSLKVKGRPGLPFLLGPAVFGILSLLIALFPTNLERIIEVAVAAVEAEKIDIDLKMWHGFTNVFWLSLLTISVGFLLFYFRERIFKIFSRLNKYFSYFELSYIFSRFIDGLLKFASKNTQVVQHGYHRYYLMIVFIISSVFSWYYLSMANDWTLLPRSSELSLPGIGIVILALIAAIIAPLTRSKIVAIITMGTIGYAISIIFMFYGAIDLAITFILVDTLTIILFVMVVNRLPEFAKFSNRITRFRDVIIALSVGGFMAVLALMAANFETNDSLKKFYIENSVPEAYGKNVVNVILVDFRALDTLGEITVLLLAGVSIYSLLKLKKN
jgi:multicomponent Na+:H+ antiporter subunit A